MELSIFEKIGILFKFIFSSFLSIEMFIISILLLAFLILNLKKDNITIQLVAIAIYLGFVLGIMISYSTYVKTCIDSFFKSILNYFYFPSTIVYFFIILFVTIMILYTIFSKRISYFKKIVNFSVFSLMYFFFMSFIALAAYDMVDFIDTALLYENDTILAIVQASNWLLILWGIFTGFYYLYLYFKKKYD